MSGVEVELFGGPADGRIFVMPDTPDVLLFPAEPMGEAIAMAMAGQPVEFTINNRAVAYRLVEPPSYVDILGVPHLTARYQYEGIR